MCFMKMIVLAGTPKFSKFFFFIFKKYQHILLKDLFPFELKIFITYRNFQLSINFWEII